MMNSTRLASGNHFCILYFMQNYYLGRLGMDRRQRRRKQMRVECTILLFVIAGLALAAYAITVYEGWPFVLLFVALLWLSNMMRTR